MQKKSLIKQNILYFIDLKGITKYKFYQDTGITRGVLDQDNGMSEENTSKFLAQYPEINPEWLLTGKGEMYRTGEKNSIQQSISGDNNTMSGKDTLTHSDSSEDKATIKELKKRIAEYEKKLEEKDKQISKLINVIEKLNSI